MSDATRPDTSGNRSIEASVGLALKMDLKTCIRPIADWPMPRVQFQDITPLLHNPQAFRRGVDALEYGSASVELHPDAVRPGDRALLRDDLIATGGAMLAGKKQLEQLEQLGATVLEGAAPINLTSLVGPTGSRRRACPCSRWLNSPGRDAGREGVPACARLPESL